MTKLIISDVDGTLVAEGSTSLNPEYFEVIKELKKKGILFVTASGRNITSLRNVFAPIADDLWMLSQNGNVICHGDECMVPNPIPREWVEAFWKELGEIKDSDGMINTERIAFCRKESTPMYHWVHDKYKYDIRAIGENGEIPEIPCSMLTLFYNGNAEDYYNKTLHPIWKERLTYLPSGETWVDMVMPGTGKGPSLKYLMDKLGIKKEEVIAFGDNKNDISMLENAGTAIAVYTAREEVKAIADKIIPSFDEDGVLSELKRILSEQ